MSVGGFLSDYAKNHTGAGRMVGKYQRYRAAHQQPIGTSPTDPESGVQPSAPPNPYDGAAGQSQQDLMGGSQEQQWTGDDTAFGPEPMAHGKLVTKPTIAKLGESGPEIVIPLNNAPGNHTRPDLLMGHLQPPQVQGLKYQRYKGYAARTL
jgi:hypothetical protein